MSKTDRLRLQHGELLALAAEITEHLSVKLLSNDASVVRSLLSELFGKLNIHLAMEDESLYPSLLETLDVEFKSIVQTFIDDMGAIGEVLEEYKNKWPSEVEIQENPKDFIDQTKAIFNTLSLRIGRENNELFKLVDAFVTD